MYLKRKALPFAVLCYAASFFPLSQALAGPPSGKEPARQAVRSNPLAVELDALSEAADEIFGLAMAGKMERAAKKLETMKKNASILPTLQDEPNGILFPRLRLTMVELEQAINAKDRLNTMRYANRITLIAANVAIALKPGIPTEVSLLDYNGRELGIWSEAKKTEKLSNIVMRMHLAWQGLMPKLVEHNGTKELKRFSDIMGKLELAKSAEDYSKLSKQVRPEMESMKALFAKPPR